MSDERNRVLQMLENGTVTADEANKLLTALEADEEPKDFASDIRPEARFSSAPPDSPDMERFRRFWQIPFFVTIGVLVLSGLGLSSAHNAASGRATFGVICMSGIFLLAMVTTVLAFASSTARWAHVRVQEKDGKRISISLPLPLALADWGLRIARNFVTGEEIMHLDTAASLIKAMREDPSIWDAGPLMVEVDDDDGRYMGMVIQHRNGKWAATWNMCPNEEDAFYLASRDDAVAELRRRYPR